MSRGLGDVYKRQVMWQTLNECQAAIWHSLPRRGRRSEVILKLDLTCIEKTGKKIPFARVFNRRYGIQLVVLHASWEGLSFPVAYRIYEGKGKTTVNDLALELLMDYPPSVWSSRVVVMADSAFASTDFIRSAQAMGFQRLLLGIRCDRKISDGRRLDQLSKRGQEHRLHDMNLAVWISWCDVKREEGKKRFYLLSTFQAGGAYLARRYRKRWLIESFFQVIKHDFGLKETRLRTKGAIKLWIFLACLAYCLAALERYFASQHMTLIQAAKQVLSSLLDVTFMHLLINLESFNQASPRTLKLVSV